MTIDYKMTKIELPVVVTPSRCELALRCYRRHVLSDILQRAKYYSPSLEFGSVMHAGVAAYWRCADKTSGEALNAALTVIAQEWQKRFEQRVIRAGDLTLAMAEAMMVNYAKTAELAGPFALETPDWQIVSIEDRLEVPLVLPGTTGKLSFQTDRVLYNKERDHLVVVDTKTAGRFDKRWERQWETSLQMKLYKAGAVRAYDLPPENIDVVIEGLLKHVPSEVRYVPCPEWSVEMLNEAVSMAQHVAWRDYELISDEDMSRDAALVIEDALVAPCSYDECFSYGVECAFRQLCVAEPSDRAAILAAEYFTIPTEDQGY